VRSSAPWDKAPPAPPCPSERSFGQVTNRFFGYVTSPQSLPAWETSYILAKYTVSTKGVEKGKP
jgi:hypothetical protein